jgi:membrane protease subunit HflK
MSLNDPQWGRGSSSGSDGKDESDRNRPPQRPERGGSQDGPPDLDELWRDFNRRLNGLFGKKGGRGADGGD